MIADIYKEKKRIEQMMVYESKLYDEGYKSIAGIDEAGRGPLAGPVVAAAVVLKENTAIYGINDSKKLTEKAREELFDKIMNNAETVGIGIVDHEEIDRVNILNATFYAMKIAVSNINTEIQHVLVDGIRIPGININQTPVIGGDSKSISIAAASIIAKVTRDRIMCKYSELYPYYGFEKHKGYGTRHHIEAIKSKGPCPIHRKSFIKKFV